MKIAILLLAHKNKQQVERLVGALRHDQMDVYIHLDQKADWTPEEWTLPHVVFTPHRYDVGLFEFSMVQAQEELIRTARAHGTYGYYIMMSGQCYPLMDAETLYHKICSSYPEPMIEIVAPTPTNYVTVNFKHVYILKRFKLRTYDFLKKHFSYKMYRLLRYIPGGFVWAVSAVKEWFVTSPRKRLLACGRPMYCGSQWWILPDRVIENVMPYFEDRAFCSIVYDTFSCDETFFQTAIMDKQEENGIVLDDDGNFMNRRWFFIFDGGHPVRLTKEHLGEMRESRMFFARKFDMGIDREVLDLLDDTMRDGI